MVRWYRPRNTSCRPDRRKPEPHLSRSPNRRRHFEISGTKRAQQTLAKGKRNGRESPPPSPAYLYRPTVSLLSRVQAQKVPHLVEPFRVVLRTGLCSRPSNGHHAES